MGQSARYAMKKRVLQAAALLLLLLSCKSVWAQKFNFPTSSGSAIISGDDLHALPLPGPYPYTLTAWCNDWDYIRTHAATWRDEFLLKNNVTIVKFRVNNFNPITKYQTPVAYNSYHLQFTLKGYTNPADTTIFTTNSDTLTINYNNSATNTPFQDINLKKYGNFYKAQLTIIDIYEDVGGIVMSAPLSDAAVRNFLVEVSITTQRYDKKEYGSAPPATLPVVAATPNVANNYLDLNWGFSTGHVTPINYELEWTYVDDYDVDPATGIETPLAPSLLYYNFLANNTRVWLDQPSYRIPLIYSRGYIVYRVRAVRPDSLLFKSPVYGGWSVPGGEYGHMTDLTSGFFNLSRPYTGDSLNWQYTASFAEGGKYKNVASFYDGLLKSRQSITRFNTSLDKLIATNNIYDFEGRPAIKTLPVPISQTAFNFQHFVDINSVTNHPYGAADFDTGSRTYHMIAPLAGTALASLYYSGQNSDTLNPLTRWQKFVPDAQGYPFVQTIFEPGFNDRVSAQGGAGRSLQIGTPNYISNLYVDAEQKRLNSLFGPNAGWQSFYTKTISKDPNQQLSMVVKDYHGKTMVSALIGSGPDPATYALTNINTANPHFLRMDLLSPAPGRQAVDSFAGTIRADVNYFSESNAIDTLRYSYSFTPFPTPCAGKYLSVQGHYHATVTDADGNVLLTQDTVLGPAGVGTSATAYTHTCNAGTFPVGIDAYHVSKTLSFSPSDVNAVLDSFFAGATCFLTEPYFVRQSVEQAEFPCVGTPVEPLDDSDECVRLKWTMMRQLFPNAVYGHYTLAGDQVRGSHNSIYTMFGCPVDTFYVGAYYPDSVLWHCYNSAYAVLGGDSSSILASEHEFGIVNYRCFCATATMGTPPGCDTITHFNTTVTITLPDLYDSTKLVYFPFVPASGGMAGNFMIRCDDWNLTGMNGPIYSGGVAVGSVSTVAGPGAGHHTTTLTLPVSVSGDTYTAAITGTAAITSTGGTGPVTFNFTGYMSPGHIDSMHHFPHFYTYDSTAVNYGSPSCYYRYQDTCTIPSLKDTITAGGTFYTGLRTMSAADFTTIYNRAIADGNYSIAEQLLPLHPQYCALGNCFADTFKTRLLAIPDWRIAQAQGVLMIDDIAAHDPLVALLGASGMSSAADSVLTLPGGTTRLDSFIFISAYCACHDSIMFTQCYNDMFHYEISNHLLVTDDARKLYFDNMYNAYFTNRQRFIDSLLSRGGNTCSHCALARMHLVPGGAALPPPVVIDTPAIAFAGPGGPANWLISMFTADEAATYDSVLALHRSEDSTLCAATVDSIVAHISNCIMGDGTLESNIRDSLNALFVAGQVSMGNYTTGQIYRVLSDNGVTMSDLCNPYIFDFSTLGATTAGNNCLPQSYYTDLNTFLGRHEVRDAFISPGSSFVFTLDVVHNEVEAEISDRLGAATDVRVVTNYDPATQLYILYTEPATGGPLNVKLFLHASPDCSTPMSSMMSSGGLLSTECISTMPSLVAGTGLVNQYTFMARIPSAGTGTAPCYLSGWIDRVHTMVHQGDDVTAACIPCTQMRTLYSRFTDTLHAYGILGPDHPCYTTMLTNFMNGALHQRYSGSDYETFIQSCALADSMLMPLYTGYSTFRFGSTTDMNGFITALNAVDPVFNFDHSYRDSSVVPGPLPITVSVDLNMVPYWKLWQYKGVLTGYGAGSGIVNHLLSDLQPMGQIGFIYANTSSSFSPASVGITDPAISFSAPYQKAVWIGGRFVMQTCYDVMQSGATPQGISRAVYSITAYLYNSNVAGVTFVPEFKSTIDADYFKPEKLEYLRYTYGFQALPDYQVLSNVQAQNLVVSIPYYVSYPYNAVYSRPQAPGIFTNLYLWNTGMNSRYYDTLQRILNLVSPSGYVFGSTPSASIPMAAPAELNAYICADKTYWYRYFTTGDTMFNVYLSFPAYIPPALRPHYYIVGGATPMPGDSLNRYFMVKAMRPGSTEVVQLFGLTNFVIGKSVELDNVLMRRSPLSDDVGTDTFDNCERQRLMAAVNEGRVNYRNYMDSLKDNVSGGFRKYALRSAGEQLMLSYTDDEQQFTLYNYDRAGNLAWTEPPAGVVPIADVGTTLTDIDNLRTYNLPYTGTYTYNKRNTYEYNSYNMLNLQKTINGGTSKFKYDAAGRLVFSQNANQAISGRYTYNLCDEQGRTMETGEAAIPAGPVLTDPATVPYASIVTLVHSLDRTDVVMTIYDTAATHLGTMPALDEQQNLRKRVSCVKYFKKLLGTDLAYTGFDYATHYSYDLQGNVQNLTQDNPALAQQHRRYIRIDYDYDLISGKVNMLSYNRGWPEQFYQKYNYDADNRITDVSTSNDGYIWSREAHYNYYDHGPLARVELGNTDMRVQGIDYAYTIQGWLKAMNTDTLNTRADMGLDGGSSSITARDAVAHTIDYFAGDYQSIALSGRQLQHIAVPVIRSLYNGNIARQTVAIDNFQKLNKQYVYDQLNRITRADYATVDPASGALTGISDFHSKYTYDPDGNIQTLLRYGNNAGSGAQQMDSLHYIYPSTTNDKLADVLDSAANVYTNDLQQYTTPGAPRYTYDAIGNTTADLVSGQTSIQWNLYNKVTQTTNPADASTLRFDYDGTGNRVGKHYAKTSATDVKTRDEYYVHDAGGNILAIYKGNSTVPATGGSLRSFALAEHNIYGSSRLGIKQYYGLELGTSSDSTGPTPVYDTFRFYSRAPWYSLEYQDVIKLDSTNLYGNALTDMYFAHHTVGQRQYELTDHLGNVMATISDKHAADSFTAIGGGGLLVGNDANVSAWKPIVISAHDYYPFGEYMPGRYRTDLAANCMTATLPTMVPSIYTLYVPMIPVPGAVVTHGSCGVFVTSPSPPLSGPPPTPYPMIYLSTTGAGSGADLTQYIAAAGTSVTVDVYSLSGKDTFMIKDDAGAIIGLTIWTTAIAPPGTTITIPITVVPHSNNVKVCVSALSATSGVIISGIHIPRDTTTSYNIVSNVCNNDFYRFGFNGQRKDNEWAGLGNHLDFGARMYDSRISRFLSVDAKFNRPHNTPFSAYAIVRNNPIIFIDPDGDDWLLSTGDKLYWYGGEAGDKRNLLHTFKASSGHVAEDSWSMAHNNGAPKDYRNSKYQGEENKGPTPSGRYFINLKPSFERTAQTIKPNPHTAYDARLKRPDDGGVEKVPERIPLDEYGMNVALPAWSWGPMRAHLEPISVNGAGSNRELNSFYIHNSTKGGTAGCIEVGKGENGQSFFDLLQYYKNAGNDKMPVIVSYPNNNHSTAGGTETP